MIKKSTFLSHACKSFCTLFELKKCAQSFFLARWPGSKCPKSKKELVCVCVCVWATRAAHPPSTYFTCMGCVGGKRVISVCVYTRSETKLRLSFPPMLPLPSLVGEKNLLFVSQNITLKRHFLHVRLSHRQRMEAALRPSPCLSLSLSLAHPRALSLSLSFTVFNSANAPSVLFRCKTISRSLSLLIFCHLEGRIQLH